MEEPSVKQAMFMVQNSLNIAAVTILWLALA